MEVGIRGFTFDLEGTLVDLELAHHLGHLAAARELGLNLDLEEAREKIKSFIGGPDIDVAAEIRNLSGKDVPIDYVFGRTRYHYITIRSSFPISAREGVSSFLQKLANDGYKIALGSVTPQVEGRELLEAAGLKAYFPEESQVFLEDVKNAKPAPDVYLETAKRSRIEPIQQLVFEDSPRGVMSAYAAGSLVIAVPAIKADTINRNLRDAGAIAIFENWKEVTLQGILKIVQNVSRF